MAEVRFLGREQWHKSQIMFNILTFKNYGNKVFLGKELLS